MIRTFPSLPLIPGDESIVGCLSVLDSKYGADQWLGLPGAPSTACQEKTIRNRDKNCRGMFHVFEKIHLFFWGFVL